MVMRSPVHRFLLPITFIFALPFLSAPAPLLAQGVTTAAITGLITSDTGTPLDEASISAVHLPSGTQYRGAARSGGAYSLPNLRVGGPYRLTAKARTVRGVK